MLNICQLSPYYLSVCNLVMGNLFLLLILGVYSL